MAPAPKYKPSQAQKVIDGLADAETFLDSAIGELKETMKGLLASKQACRIQRMNMVRKMKAAGIEVKS